MNRIAMLSGVLDEQGLPGILEAMSLTRQLSCLEISSPLGALEGSIWLKSGKLLEITAGSRTGIDALRYLVDRQGSYDVFRAEGRVDNGIAPLMSIDDALEEVKAPSGAPPSLGRSTGMQAVGTSAGSERPPETTPARREATPPPVEAAPTPPVRELNRPSPRPTPYAVAVTPAPTRPATPIRPTTMPSRPAPSPVAVEHVSSPPPPSSPPRSSAPAWVSAANQHAPPSVRAVLRPAAAGPILTIFANKGGVGKTTFSVNLAVTLARRGMRVYLVDADPRNDVGNAIAARRDTSLGLFDVLDGSATLGDTLLETALPGFTILPAGGVGLTEERFQAASARADSLASVLASLSGPGAIVIVDTPPGLRGITHSVLRASTHAVVMVQAEPIAVRAAALVQRALDALPAGERPALAGVVLNMLDRRVGASIGMLEEACQVFGADAVLDIAIPRSGIFIEASEKGSPVALLDGESSHALGWIFESLASAILARAGLSTPKFAELRLL